MGMKSLKVPGEEKGREVYMPVLIEARVSGKQHSDRRCFWM